MPAMEVNVKLISTFRKYQDIVNDDKAHLKNGSTVRDLALKIGLPLKIVKLTAVNGKQTDLDFVLSNGDTVHFFPPAIGGG
jgi:molybdopterin converting factor small subunit